MLKNAVEKYFTNQRLTHGSASGQKRGHRVVDSLCSSGGNSRGERDTSLHKPVKNIFGFTNPSKKPALRSFQT